MRGCCVTGTDTGVGKSVLTAAVVAWLRERGVAVRALKPIITGLDDPRNELWPPDHELLGRIAGRTAQETMLIGYGPPVSPHLAAQRADRPIDVAALATAIRARAAPDEVLVVEGVGGLLVPLSETADVRDLAVALGLPLLIAGRPGLGTINHTLLTLEAARAYGLAVAGVVLTPWPETPTAVERSNLETIAARGRVEVGTLGAVPGPEPRALAQAAAALPLKRWLA